MSDCLDALQWNRAATLKRLGGDRELLAEMIAFFEEDADALLKQIVECRAGQDFRGIERAAHSLKGIAATFDGFPAMHAAAALESAAAGKQAGDWDERINQVRDAVEGLSKALAKESASA